MRTLLPTRRRFRLLPLLLLLPVAAGCGGGNELVVAEHIRTIDSLRVADRAMRAELYAIQDSIRFYDDVESGQYFRERNTLMSRLDRLQYELAACGALPPPAEVLGIDDLFEPASATLTEAGATRLAALADTLRAAPTGTRFRIEAHSDNTPVGGTLKEKYPSNWELSAARAASVVRHLAEVHALPAARFEVVSLAETRPETTNSTPAGRRLNRRIHVVIVPGQPNQ